jgi:hypothetical protein
MVGSRVTTPYAPAHARPLAPHRRRHQVFFMQTGFAMLCAGLVRANNTKNILLKTFWTPASAR